jgi:hypothetical protein
MVSMDGLGGSSATKMYLFIHLYAGLEVSEMKENQDNVVFAKKALRKTEKNGAPPSNVMTTTKAIKNRGRKKLMLIFWVVGQPRSRLGINVMENDFIGSAMTGYAFPESVLPLLS